MGFGASALAVENSSKKTTKVLVLGSYGTYYGAESQTPTKEGQAVEVYETDGTFLHSFGEGMWKEAQDLAATNDGRVMVLDYDRVDAFSAQGYQLYMFSVAVKRNQSIKTFAETICCTSDYVIVVLHHLWMLSIKLYCVDTHQERWIIVQYSPDSLTRVYPRSQWLQRDV